MRSLAKEATKAAFRQTAVSNIAAHGASSQSTPDRLESTHGQVVPQQQHIPMPGISSLKIDFAHAPRLSG